jgi:hypothetical protein
MLYQSQGVSFSRGKDLAAIGSTRGCRNYREIMVNKVNKDSKVPEGDMQ